MAKKTSNFGRRGLSKKAQIAKFNFANAVINLPIFANASLRHTEDPQPHEVHDIESNNEVYDVTITRNLSVRTLCVQQSDFDNARRGQFSTLQCRSACGRVFGGLLNSSLCYLQPDQSGDTVARAQGFSSTTIRRLIHPNARNQVVRSSTLACA